jgi:hypothetical protein
LPLLAPWAVLSALIGVLHGGLFHFLLGSEVKMIPRAIALAVAGSLVGGALGTTIPPAIISIGDTNLIATSLSAWGFLALGRLFRVC